MGVTGKVLTTDVVMASAACRHADECFRVPHTGRIEYVPALLDIVERQNVGLIVPLTDLDLRSLARQKERFDKVGCQVMVGSEEAVRLCRDKAQTNKMLQHQGLATITTLTLEQFHQHPFYPCFVKPVGGSAGVGTGLIHSARELKAHMATFGQLLLVQEYLPGQEYTIDVYVTRSGVIRCIVPRHRLVVRSGEVEKAITAKDDELIEATRKLVGGLKDLWGAFCCQCRRPPGRPPRFFEINPRFGGGVPLSIAAGANLPAYLLQDVLERPFDQQPVDAFTDRLLMLRYDRAVFIEADDPTALPGYDAPVFR